MNKNHIAYRVAKNFALCSHKITLGQEVKCVFARSFYLVWRHTSAVMFLSLLRANSWAAGASEVHLCGWRVCSSLDACAFGAAKWFLPVGASLLHSRGAHSCSSTCERGEINYSADTGGTPQQHYTMRTFNCDSFTADKPNNRRSNSYLARWLHLCLPAWLARCLHILYDRESAGCVFALLLICIADCVWNSGNHKARRVTWNDLQTSLTANEQLVRWINLRSKWMPQREDLCHLELLFLPIHSVNLVLMVLRLIQFEIVLVHTYGK